MYRVLDKAHKTYMKLIFKLRSYPKISQFATTNTVSSTEIWSLKCSGPKYFRQGIWSLRRISHLEKKEILIKIRKQYYYNLAFVMIKKTLKQLFEMFIIKTIFTWRLSKFNLRKQNFKMLNFLKQFCLKEKSWRFYRVFLIRRITKLFTPNDSSMN